MSSSSPFNQESQGSGNFKAYYLPTFMTKSARDLVKAKKDYLLLEDSVTNHEKPKRQKAFSSSTDLEHLISGTPETLASLVAAKKESRINQSEHFCCFTLKEQTEFNLFLRTLSQNLNNLTDGTRFSVLVKKGCHWFPIDFYFKNNKIHTFLLDAYNYNGTLPGTKRDLEHYFPKSKHCHYSFYAGRERQNALQKSGRGCRVFSSYHAFNMSKIPAEVMYRDLEKDSTGGLIKIDTITRDSSLLKLLRPSHSSLEILSEEVMGSTIVRKKGNTTLKKVVDESSHVESGRSKNITMNHKSDVYRRKIINYFDSHDEEQKIMMVSQRSGMTYIAFPRLFDFDKLLSESDDETAIRLIKDFASRLKSITSLSHSEIINKNINIIEGLIANYEEGKKGLLVSATLQATVSLRDSLTNAGSKRTLALFDKCINEILLECQAIKPESPLNQKNEECEEMAHRSSMDTPAHENQKSNVKPTWNLGIVDWIKRNPKKTIAIIAGVVVGSLISGGVLPLAALGLGAGGLITSMVGGLISNMVHSAIAYTAGHIGASTTVVAGVAAGMLASAMTGLVLYIGGKAANCCKSQNSSTGSSSLSGSSHTIFSDNGGNTSRSRSNSSSSIISPIRGSVKTSTI